MFPDILKSLQIEDKVLNLKSSWEIIVNKLAKAKIIPKTSS